MRLLLSTLSSITMYRLMLYFLSILVGAAILLSAFDVLPYNPIDILGQTVAFVALCWGANALIARVLKVQANIESSLITGLILSAIVGPLLLPQQWLVVVVASLAAILSKYLLVYRKSHLLNPAAFGVLVSALTLGHSASWWIGSTALLPVIVVGGVLVMVKIRRWHLIASFMGTYLGLLVLYALVVQGSNFTQTLTLVQNIALSPSLLFFAFVMLIEPLTAPQTTRRRIAFGAFVGAVLFALPQFVSAVSYVLELSLLIGNVFARLINPDFRQAFVLRKKEFVSSSVGSFWFEPTRKFTFGPGQFLEYTLAHPSPDGRGVRRYFSIASSPTESQVLLTARFSDPGSTFKAKLQEMREGEEIVASKVAGDFVLPSDSTKKIAFIAGGIGVTPFRSMVKYLLDTDQSRDIVLLYGARQKNDLVFQDLFEEAHHKFGMRTFPVIDQMIDENVIRKEIPDFVDRLFYVSGPEPMVQGLTKLLIGIGVARRQIKRDYFPGYAETQ
ncbi:MAG: RnfABCDGE type electron transport complex subunit D [Candidatus Andersenbacteria bacterium]